jgi:hypothetical protein
MSTSMAVLMKRASIVRYAAEESASLKSARAAVARALSYCARMRRVLGLEFSTEMEEIARSKAPAASLRYKFGDLMVLYLVESFVKASCLA